MLGYQLRERFTSRSIVKPRRLYLGGRAVRNILAFCKAPKNPDATKDYLHNVYKSMPRRVDDGYLIAISYHGNVHQKIVYMEPMKAILDLEIYQLSDYLNDNHHKNQIFSNYWISITDPPAFMLTLGKVVFIGGINKYIHIMDVIPPERCRIYPGYDGAVLGSGKEINMSLPQVSYVTDNIIYIRNEDDILQFDDIEQARCDYMKRRSREYWECLLQQAIAGKIKIGQDPCRRIYKAPFNYSCFEIYVQGELISNDIPYKDGIKNVKWRMATNEWQQSFNIGDRLDKDNEKTKWYMEQVDFCIIKMPPTIRIKGVVLKQNKKTLRIEGKRLLDSSDDDN